MTKPKTTRTAAQEEARRNAWAAGAPTSAAPDETTPTLAQPVRICNASVRDLEHYFTGYGEVHQPLRAGATQAMQLPSRGFST